VGGAVPFDLVEHVLVGPAEDDGAGGGLLAALEEDEVVVADCLLDYLVALAEEGGVEDFLALGSGHGGDDGGAGEFGDALEVALVDSAEPDAAGLDHVLGGEVVDAHLGEDDVGAGLQDLGDSALEDVAGGTC
jgi:hypothetical protein